MSTSHTVKAGRYCESGGEVNEIFETFNVYLLCSSWRRTHVWGWGPDPCSEEGVPCSETTIRTSALPLGPTFALVPGMLGGLRAGNFQAKFFWETFSYFGGKAVMNVASANFCDVDHGHGSRGRNCHDEPDQRRKREPGQGAQLKPECMPRLEVPDYP